MKPEGRLVQAGSRQPAAESNVMPSMVVRQQRIQQMGATSANQIARGSQPPSSREPATLAAAANGSRKGQLEVGVQPAQLPPLSSQQPPPLATPSLIKAAKELGGLQQHQAPCLFDQDGLVLPKRVPHYPVAAAAQPIIRDLNRELKFNQIRGKNVLDQKSELKKALEKLEESKRRKEAEQERLNRRTSLELRLEERAERLAAKEASGANLQRMTSVGDGASTASSTLHSAAAANANSLSNFSIKPITR